VSEVKKPGDIVNSYTLWRLAVLQSEDGQLVPFGAENSDPAAILRTYDYRTEQYPDEEYRILKTRVVVEMENVEDLREKLAQASADGENPDVHSG
jgi:ribonucleotide reductase alpha subunit